MVFLVKKIKNMILPSKEFMSEFKETIGAFSTAEAIALYNIVLSCEQGIFLELGSHKGKSSMVIASAMPTVSSLVLVEPEFQNKEWSQEVISNVSKYTKNSVIGMASFSLNVIPLYNELSFCFVDSGLHDDMVLEEVKLLEDRILPNGVIALHDFLNQFTAVERAYNYLVSTGKYEPITIDWNPIFDYVRATDLEANNVSWHESGSMEFPCFVGAVRRK